MTSRTHDLAAVTLVVYIASIIKIPHMSIATLLIAGGMTIMGAVAPDLDEPTAALWQRFPAGSIVGRIFHPFVGGHRMISHSLIGLAIAGLILRWLLNLIHGTLIVDMDIVWSTFMLGFLSHLIADTVTKEGVPWLFPIPMRIGIPPFRWMRMSTGGMLEKGVIFPGLLITNIWLVYSNYSHFGDFIFHGLKK